MKNSVCYISKIREIKSIENADNIELALVEGWQCIIKKGEFKKNDNVILITEGAIIPEDLAQSCYFLCTSDASWITGHTLIVDGGTTFR